MKVLNKQLTKNCNIGYPNTVEIFCRSKKGCMDMYNLLISKKITYPKSETKWMSELELTKKEWRKIYSLPFKCTKDSKLLWLQYQLLHRILPINYYLHRVGIVNSSLCYFCQQTPETIEHIFVDCYLVKEIWIELEKWMTDIFGLQTSFDKYSILFGKYDNRDIHRLENLIILFTKQYILQSKMKTSRLNVNIIKKSITRRLFIEKLLLLKNCNYYLFDTYWKDIFQRLEHSSPSLFSP